jgi:predicted transcriptional regulator
MLKFGSSRKNKIDLNDYDYRLDIENRLLMSQLSTFDVEVLEEILMSSLTSDLQTLATALEAVPTRVEEAIDKFTKTGLLRREGKAILVDKEMRKYYESQIRKFDDDFKPNLQFMQDLLNKVPIHVLPQWYSIPRTSTNIFESIVEKYLLTPRVFQRYLLELNLGDPIIEGILNDVYSAPDFKVRSRDLRQKYGLDREAFEEYMLHLEFNFLCCLSYSQVDDQWKEVVTPYHEWRQHLRYLRDTMPETIHPETAIAQTRPGDRAFIRDFLAILSSITAQPLAVEQVAPPHYFRARRSPLEQPLHPDYVSWHLYKLHSLQLVALEAGKLHATEYAADWSRMAPEDAALALYRHPDNAWRDPELQEEPKIEREFREVERSLQRVADRGWVPFEEFIKGVMAPVRGASEVTLQRVGRRWAYTRPTYTPAQVAFIREMIFERFFEAGFTEIGSMGDSLCFKVTSIGKSMTSL